MNIPPVLGPAAVLVLWTLVILTWVTFTRFSAFAKAGIDIKKATAGARYCDIESEMPARVNWVSHNYTHLMEQPTIFYAVIAVLAIAGEQSWISLAAAWGYVLLRIVHSLWQVLVNLVPFRATLFTLSTLCLWILALRAVWLSVAGQLLV